jgi:hypothetical protein
MRDAGPLPHVTRRHTRGPAGVGTLALYPRPMVRVQADSPENAEGAEGVGQRPALVLGRASELPGTQRLRDAETASSPEIASQQFKKMKCARP